MLWRGTWRARSVDSIVAELKFLKERYGVDTLEVADEYPTCDAERWERDPRPADRKRTSASSCLGRRGPTTSCATPGSSTSTGDAGFLHMYVGVESPIQGRLDWMRKGLESSESRRSLELLNDAGIITETSFLLGYPDDTPETVDETLRLAIEYAPDLAFFLAITPWPYAELYREVADRVEVATTASTTSSTPSSAPTP